MAFSCLMLTQIVQTSGGPLTVNGLLEAYRHDSPLLFLSSAFITVGVVAAGFCLVRRRFDPLLLFLALFAYLYGQRLRLESEMLHFALADNRFFLYLRVAMNYLVPIPAFAFFEAAGFLGRWGKRIVLVISFYFLSLVVSVFLFGPLRVFDYANAAAIVLLVPALAVRSHLMRRPDRDFLVVRVGLIFFVCGSLWDNIVGTFFHRSDVEPYCFAIFLATLGYVAARQMLRRERELVEVQGELDLARRIQHSLLPAGLPASRHLRIAVRYRPMTSVAGDLYEFLEIVPVEEPRSAAILVADVSGHGVPAALIASMVKMAASSASSLAGDPAELLMSMNRALCGNTQDQFVTAACVHVDAGARLLRYAAAGHPAMLRVRGGQVEEIVANGLPLGFMKEMEYDGISALVMTGDRLILHTDGLIEARDAAGVIFGEARLHRLAVETAGLDAEEAVERMMAAVMGWSRVQEDDLTVVVCDFLG